MEKFERVSVRLVNEPPLLSDRPIHSPPDAVRLLGEVLKQYDKEVLSVINVKTDKRPINCSIVSQGDIKSSIAVPSQILKTAILSNATGIIMLHNHPSGSLTPGIEDMYTTERVEEACNIMGMNFLDHIIVAPGTEQYYSFRENSIIPADTLCPEDIQDKTEHEDNIRLKEHEKSVTEVIMRCLKIPDTDSGIMKAYSLLENLISELDSVLKTDMECPLRRKAEEEGLIKTDIENVRNYLLNGRSR